MSEPDEFLLAAMREVDALTPACPPIAPPEPAPSRHLPPNTGYQLRFESQLEANAIQARYREMERCWLEAQARSLVVPGSAENLVNLRAVRDGR